MASNSGSNTKGFGLDALFQGVADYSRMMNVSSVYWPLRNNTNVSDWYLHDKIRWTEEARDIANVPRLTTLNNSNNFRNSTQWLVNGDYFKLRNLNVYYNLPQRWISKSQTGTVPDFCPRQQCVLYRPCEIHELRRFQC